MGFLLLMAIIVIYIILGILYESFIHPVTILSGLIPAGFGAFGAIHIRSSCRSQSAAFRYLYPQARFSCTNVASMAVNGLRNPSCVLRMGDLLIRI